MSMVKYTILPLLTLLQSTVASTGSPTYPISVQPHNYTDSTGFLLQGFLSKPPINDDSDADVTYPAIIILHDQDGPNEYEQQRATLIAQTLNYIGFAADIYGYGVELPPEGEGWGGPRAEFVSQFTGNASLFSSRIDAAVDYVSGLEYVDESKIVIVGYCLGGTGVVHYLNTGGGDVAGVCGVHPSLFGDWGGPVGSVEVPALFLTGGSDFLTGPQAMATLEADMTRGATETTPWETVRYAKIGHAFSNWFSEDNYDERVDARSWESFTKFASEVFGTGASADEEVEPKVTAVNYTDAMDNDYPLKGYVAIPDDAADSTPVVVILPGKMDNEGPGSYEQIRATQIAHGENQNYIAFVADIYSYDRKDTAAYELEELYYSNSTKFMSRIHAAIEYAKSIDGVNSNNLALVGFGFGGSGALMYGMGVGGKIDSAVKAIASFHGEVAKVVNATVAMFGAPEDASGSGFDWSGGASSSNWGASEGGNESDTSWESFGDSSAGSWGSGSDGWNASNASWGSFDGSSSGNWSPGLDGSNASASSWGSGEGVMPGSRNVSTGSENSGQEDSTWSDEAPKYPWDERSLAVEPQILIQSGVEGDDMNDIIQLENMLIGIGSNYELSRFSGAQGRFTDWESSTYDSRATVRSFDQLESLLLEVFAGDGSDLPTAVTVPIEELVAAPNPAPADDGQQTEISEPTLSEDGQTQSPTPDSGSTVGFIVSVPLLFFWLGMPFLVL